MSHDDRKRAIGKVISVAADRFVVEMHAGTDNFTVIGFDDIHYVARLGSFLVIPQGNRIWNFLDMRIGACPIRTLWILPPARQFRSVLWTSLSPPLKD